MKMLVNFTPEIKDWITLNLERGCAPGDLVSCMIDQKFDPKVAHGLVDTFLRARSNGEALPEGSVTLDFSFPEYEYEQPRLPPGTQLKTSDRIVPILMRLQQPVVAVLGGVLSHDECDQLIATAKPRLKPSTIVDPATGENKTVAHRNSEGMFFALEETPFIAMLDRRISELINCPVENGEGLQVLRYGPGAHNAPHFDFLVPMNQTNCDSIERSGQRISSLVIYLNDVAGGGETEFPEIGLSVSPVKGNAVYFEYANSLGQLDHRSLHAGAPVSKGEKWVVTKWMRERRFQFA